MTIKLKHIKIPFKRPALKLNSALFISGLVFINIVIFTTIISYNKARLEDKEKLELYNIRHKLSNLNEELNHVINDLLTLSESTLLRNYWTSNNDSSIKSILENDYSSVLNNNMVYDQIRVIDSSGIEIIRVNYNNGLPSPTKEQELQDKSNRYYFTDAFKIEKGNIYMSPLDLNVENGEIEIPEKPMIRLATPVFNKNGDKCGIIIINYLAKHMLNQTQPDNESNIETLLINSDGYFFKGFSPDEEWLFMYPDKKQITIRNYIGAFYDSLQMNTFFQFKTGKGLYTSNTLNFSECYFSHYAKNQITNNNYEHYIINSEKNWSIIRYIPHKTLFKENNQRLLATILLLILLNSIAYLVFKKIRFINNQKEEAFKALKENRDELVQINENKDKLYSILAHDLKNPFNSMIGFSEVLVRKYDQYNDEKRLYLINIISSSINITYQLLENLLIWTKSQTGHFKYNPENINLSLLTSSTIDECNTQSRLKKITVENQINKHTEVYADQYMLNIVIRNIISNAIKFSFENSKVLITSIEEDNLHTICIKDFGLGMNKEIKESIFNKSDNKTIIGEGTANEKGTGLGLLLCKELIELQNGKIWAESEPHKGSQFFISIPKLN